MKLINNGGLEDVEKTSASLRGVHLGLFSLALLLLPLQLPLHELNLSILLVVDGCWSMLRLALSVVISLAS